MFLCVIRRFFHQFEIRFFASTRQKRRNASKAFKFVYGTNLRDEFKGERLDGTKHVDFEKKKLNIEYKNLLQCEIIQKNVKECATSPLRMRGNPTESLSVVSIFCLKTDSAEICASRR